MWVVYICRLRGLAIPRELSSSSSSMGMRGPVDKIEVLREALYRLEQGKAPLEVWQPGRGP